MTREEVHSKVEAFIKENFVFDASRQIGKQTG